MKRPPFILFAVLLLVTGMIGYFLFGCPLGRPTRCNLDHVEVGMTIEEVEAILGPGYEVSGVPVTPYGPVITGDRFWQFAPPQGRFGGVAIIVSFKDGLVFDKYYWEPSL